MILPLQSLRGIFIVLIFLSHVGVLACGGDCGVAFFFALSGYVLARSHPDGVESLPRFWLKRYARLQPLNVVCLVAAVALSGVVGPSLALNLMLLQSWSPNPDIFFGGNSVAWFLSDLLLCYLLFPVLVKVISRYVWALIPAIVVYLVGIQFVIGGSDEVLWDVYVCPPMRVMDFAIGIAAWRCTAAGSSWSSWLAIGVMLATMWLWPMVPERYALASLWWPAVWLMLTAFGAENSGLPGRMLSWPPLVWFGNLSFCFYLVHGVCIKAVHQCFEPDVWLLTCVAFVASLVAAWALNKAVERPVQKFLRRRLNF